MNLEAVYTTVCYKYLTKNKEATIEDAEKILFLMQYARLKEENRTVYDERTYINEEGIHITYISDLLRVMPPTEMSSYPSLITYGVWQNRPSIHTVIRNEKEAEEYAKMPIAEIAKQVNEILQTEEFDRYYFVHKTYQNRRMRLQARFYGRICTRTKFKDIIKFFSYVFLLMMLCLFTMGGLAILLRAIFFTIKLEDIYVFISFYLSVFIPWLIITYKWTRPTIFEIENNYLPKKQETVRK